MRRVIGAVALIVAACGGGGGDATDASSAVQGEGGELVAGPADSVVIPPLPAPRRGLLVAASGGPVELSGAWQAWAGRCRAPAMLQLWALEPASVGVLMVLDVPADGALGAYPVVADSIVVGQRAARIAVQWFSRHEGRALRAVSGEVGLRRWTEHGVSGHALVVLEDVVSRQQVGFAAAFEHVPVQELSQEACTPLDSVVRR